VLSRRQSTSRGSSTSFYSVKRCRKSKAEVEP
jgi:hypothetical protein